MAHSSDLPRYDEEAISTLLAHWLWSRESCRDNAWRDNDQGGTSDITTEWKMYGQLIVNKPENNMKLQLKELASNDKLKTMFPYLSKLATNCLSIPASLERSFSQMKLINT